MFFKKKKENGIGEELFDASFHWDRNGQTHRIFIMSLIILELLCSVTENMNCFPLKFLGVC